MQRSGAANRPPLSAESASHTSAPSASRVTQVSASRPPGPVAIATTGAWDGKSIGLEGGPHPAGNHAKIGVSTRAADPYVVFADMNQDGALSGTPKQCKASQNGRGGLFFVLKNTLQRFADARLVVHHQDARVPHTRTSVSAGTATGMST